MDANEKVTSTENIYKVEKEKNGGDFDDFTKEKTNKMQPSPCITDEESCGLEICFGKCKSKRVALRFLNCCNNAKGILAFLCFAIFLQGMAVNGIVNIVISTLEKRFHLKSSETGFIAGCYDLGFLIAVSVVTFIGGRGHKPLWIGWGVFIMGLGSLTFSLPHFIAPKYSINEAQSYICGDNASNTECGESYMRVYRGFFILGNILHGIGASGLFTLGVTYLDANVKETSSSTYHGILFAFSVAGPGIGYLLGGFFIRFYVNIDEKVDITEDSSLWMGNWWLGFIFTGGLAILISLPILLYPKQLPGTSKYRLDREQEMNQNSDAIQAKKDANFGKSAKDIPRCLKVVLKNITLVFLSVAGAMDSGLVIALATFGPKYTEAMFRLPASKAALYFGILSIVSACSAHLIGGCVISKMKLKVPTMLKFCIVCSTLALGCLFIFLLQCENPMVPGVNVPHNLEDTYSCSGSCGCSVKLYDPVCGADGLTYLSFCDAGCIRTDDGEYINCTQIFKSDMIPSLNASTATNGKCDVNTCPDVGIMLAFGALAVFFTFLKFQPALQASLRTVPFEQRSFAIGIQWVIMRVLGLIPLPIILGLVLDSSCLVWEEVCGECGSCKLYDNASMTKYMTILFTVPKALSVCCILLALITYKPPLMSDSASDLQMDTTTSEVQSNTNGNNHRNELPSNTASYDNEAFAKA
ncbi:solute carrier organic anion transporter family member 4A1-like [Styela clava]